MSSHRLPIKKRTDRTGNTNRAILTRHRTYFITVWDEEDAIKLKNMEYKFIVIGKEHCPTTGRLHFHCYINFKHPKEFPKLKKELSRSANIKVAEGSADANIKYLSKEELWFMDGKKPRERVTAKELQQMSNEEIVEMDPRCAQAYMRNRDILNNNINIREWKKDVTVVYIQGPSGSGKTEKAKKIVLRNTAIVGETVNIIKYENGFYSGIGDAKTAIYDDWRDSHMKPSEFINLIDYNIQNMNIKGGSVKNKYMLIIITSVQRIEDIYPMMINNEPRKQWMRKIKVIDKYPTSFKRNNININDLL